MPSFRNLLLPITLSLVATTTAATCPQNWFPDTALNGDSKCCYGNMVIDGRDAYCCVYDMNPDLKTSSVSTATTTSDDYDSWSTAGGCFTKIPFTASDYSDQVSSASSKVVAATTTIATNEATSTTAMSSSSSTSGTSSGTGSGMTSGMSSGMTSGMSSSTSPGSTTTATNAAMPIATAQELVLGGAAVVVGLFVL